MGGVNLYEYAGSNPIAFNDPYGLCPEFLTGVPCSNGFAIAVGFIPGIGDAVDVLSVGARKDILTGEKLGDADIALTLVGTLVGSGKAAREGVGAVSSAVRHVPMTQLDRTGKLHGALPSHVPQSWNKEQLESFAGDLRSSIGTRKLDKPNLRATSQKGFPLSRHCQGHPLQDHTRNHTPNTHI